VTGTNQLINRNLRNGAWAVTLGLATACGRKQGETVPQPTAPLPTAGMAAQPVDVLPLTLFAADEGLHWQAQLADRRTALTRADSIIGALLAARAPEVTWVLPNELRRAARRAPGVAPDPDQLGTALLFRARTLKVVPDPLRSELRTLSALAGSGSARYALLPVGLVFTRPRVQPGTQPAPVGGPGTAELTVVITDVRTGVIGFRTVARGDGDDPWSALTRAMKSLTPGLP
jgi:hypothetical protein